MTVKTQKVIICDNCGKSRELNGDHTYVSINFKYLDCIYDDLHFCSPQCSSHWITDVCKHIIDKQIDNELMKVISENRRIIEVN